MTEMAAIKKSKPRLVGAGAQVFNEDGAPISGIQSIEAPAVPKITAPLRVTFALDEHAMLAFILEDNMRAALAHFGYQIYKLVGVKSISCKMTWSLAD